MLRYLTFAAIAHALAGSSPVSASAVVVPDDYPTLRLAVESQADTVLIRSGDYSERLRMKFGPFTGFPRSASLVLMAHPDESGLPSPRLAAVELTTTESDGRLECRGLRVGGAFSLNGSENGSHNPVLIESCVIDSGLYVGDSDAIVRSCRIRGRAIFHYSNGRFESDTLVQGGGILAQGEGGVSVVGCVFEGPGDVAFESVMFNNGDVAFTGNRVSDYQIGMRAGATDAVISVKDNLIERSGTGITVSRGVVEVSGNELRDCGTGVVAVGEGFTITHNRVLGSFERGIVAGFSDEAHGVLAHNVVGRSGDDGIVVDRDGGSLLTIASNTSFSNGGAGFVARGLGADADLQRNIAFGNQGSGLHVSDAVGIALACNDWFANTLGAVNGAPVGATDLSVDPQFCDVAAGDVSLFDSSPLLDASGCGLVGALGVGCGAGHTQTVTVPDDYPTIQSALDSGASLVMVRSGSYPETLSVTRPVTIRGIPPAAVWPQSLPELTELAFDTVAGFFVHSQYVTIENFRITHAIRNTYTAHPYTNPFTIQLVQCVLDQGLHDDEATTGGQLFYEFVGCEINGSIRLDEPMGIRFSSCVINQPIDLSASERITLADNVMTGQGPVGASIDAREDVYVTGNAFDGYEVPLQIGDASIRVTENVFQGPGACAIKLRCGDPADVSRNKIVGYDTGLHHGVAGRLRGDLNSFDNRIEGCSTIGMFAEAEWVTSRRDTILDCGRGASLVVAEKVIVEDGLLLSCDGDGLNVSGEDVRVEGTVVGGCGGDGIRAATTLPSSIRETMRLKQNTSYSNGGSGFSVSFVQNTLPAEIDRNIGYGNGGFGLAVETHDSLTVGCNDWFANIAGPMTGRPMAPTDLTVDPQFCDVDADDVSLLDSSPLLDGAGCGLIGARGLGCGTTPVLVALLRAQPVEDGVRIEWQWGGLERPADFWIERAETSSGPWAPITTERYPEDRITVDLDRHVEAGRTYYYRLGWLSEEGERAVSETISATVPRVAGFVLGPIAPNPSRSRVEIAWTLPRAGQTDLTVFDIAGRDVARLASGHAAAGNHTSIWNGLAPPGLYLVRLRYDDREVTRRVLLRR